MQEKSHTLSPVYSRVDHLRVVLNKTWDEMAELLEIDRSMFFHLKAGRRNLSKKAVFRLEQAEIEAGINSSNVNSSLHLNPNSDGPNISPVKHLGPLKNLKISDLEVAIEAFKRSHDAMAEGIAALEKLRDKLGP